MEDEELVKMFNPIVLKTGPDRSIRPVQLGIGLQSGPVMTENQNCLKIGK